MDSFRRTLSTPTKLLLALCVVQGVCLIAGLWIRGQFQDSVLDAMTQYAVKEGRQLTASEARGVELLVGFVSFAWICGLQTSAAWLIIQRVLNEEIRRANGAQESALLKAKELVRTRDAVIFGLAKLAESRDPETGHHLERLSMYSMKLASALRKLPRYRDIVTPSFVRTIGISSVLHDIGKVGVEDAVLLKPGKLTEDERMRIKTHTMLGGECIMEIERRLGDSEFLRMAREIAFHHHERWDGDGYPAGLKTESIPLAARIVAICDVYDALSVTRVYKPAFPHDFCVQEIRKGAGTQFDPELVKVFLTISDQFRDISIKFSDIAKRSGNTTDEQERLLISIFDAERESIANRVQATGSRPMIGAN